MLLLSRHATALRATRALSTTTTKPWFRAAGEGTLLLRFGNGIDEATNRNVLRRLDALGQKPRGVTDAVPAYASLAVHYDCTEISRDDVENWINAAAGRAAAAAGRGGDRGRLARAPRRGGAREIGAIKACESVAHRRSRIFT